MDRTTDNHNIIIERCDGCNVEDGADGVILIGEYVESIHDDVLIWSPDGSSDIALLCDDCTRIIFDEGSVAKFDRGV